MGAILQEIGQEMFSKTFLYTILGNKIDFRQDVKNP